MANDTQIAVWRADSLKVTSWSFLCSTNRSRISNRAMTTMNISMNRFSVICLRVMG